MKRAPRQALGTFVGREAELAQIDAMFREGFRLVTIWGMGGMGKTRLALEVLRREAREGTFVDLAERVDEDGLLAELADALEAPIGPARSSAHVIAQLGRALAARRDVLVVFDNFEQLPPSAARTIAALLDAAPRARLLVTSRERLRIPAEATLELHPLGVDGAGGESDAERLFLQRARELGLDTAWAPSHPGLATVLRQLEGIPLAIELAVARLEVLGLEGLRDRLPGQLDVLARGPKSAPARHRTMRAAVAWSWALLSEDERDALARLCVFRAGFTLRAAEAVLARTDALDVIDALREKALLRGRHALPEEPRFTLYEAVRAYGLDVLGERGARDETVRRHDAFFVEAGRAWTERLRARGDAAARASLSRETENLLDVHARALAETPATADSVGRAAAALDAAGVVLATEAPAARVLALFRSTTERCREVPMDPALAIELGAGLGRALFAAGQLDEAERVLEAAATGAVGLGRADLEARCALDLGIALHRKRDLARASEAYERALGACRGRDAERSEARALGNLAAIDHDARRFEPARRRYRRSIAVASAIQDAQVEGIMTANLAVLEQDEGRLDRALAAYERAIDLLSAAGDVRLLAITRANLGMLHAERGGLSEARAELERARDAQRAIGDAHSLALTAMRLAVVLALHRERAAASAQLEEGATLFSATEDDVGLAIADLVERALDLPGFDQAALAALREALDRAEPLTKISDDARAIFRTLRRAAERVARGAPPEIDEADDALVVARGGEAFRPPGGAWQFVSDHAAAARVVARLVALRRADPSRRLPVAEVTAAGWPGQKILAEAAANRVYVVVAWLRKRGFPLVRDELGYAIDPAVPVQEVQAPSAPRPAPKTRAGKRSS